MVRRSTRGYYKPSGFKGLLGKVKTTLRFDGEVFTWGAGGVHISNIQSVWHDDWDQTSFNVKTFNPNLQELAVRNDGNVRRLFCETKQDARAWRKFLVDQISHYHTKKFQLSVRERPVHYRRRAPGDSILNSMQPRPWKCSSCSRKNEPERLSCEQCGREKRPSNSRSRSLPPKVFVTAVDEPLIKAWKCTECTFMNERMIYQCEMCNRPNVASAPDESEQADTPSQAPKKPKSKGLLEPELIDFSTSTRSVSAPLGSLLKGTSLDTISSSASLPPKSQPVSSSKSKSKSKADKSQRSVLKDASTFDISHLAPHAHAPLSAPPSNDTSDSSDDSDTLPLLASHHAGTPEPNSLPPGYESISTLPDATEGASYASSSPISPESPRSDHDERQVSPRQGAVTRAQSLGTCVICMDAEITHVVVPCGHASTCGQCASRMLLVSPLCPICRRRIQRVTKLCLPLSATGTT